MSDLEDSDILSREQFRALSFTDKQEYLLRLRGWIRVTARAAAKAGKPQSWIDDLVSGSDMAIAQLLTDTAALATASLEKPPAKGWVN